jgi:hypothetical protein
MGTKILQAALALHDRVSQTFRKTAINFHYEFTVRHLANVFQGLLMSTPEAFNSPTKWGKLWLHESERVYADRLVSVYDLDAYNKAATTIAKKYFNVADIDDYYRRKEPKPLIFCNFARGLADKAYDEVPDYASLYKTLTEALNEYNETNAAMDLVLFEDAMKHVCRISRIVSNPSGHALLVRGLHAPAREGGAARKPLKLRGSLLSSTRQRAGVGSAAGGVCAGMQHGSLPAAVRCGSGWCSFAAGLDARAALLRVSPACRWALAAAASSRWRASRRTSAATRRRPSSSRAPTR